MIVSRNVVFNENAGWEWSKEGAKQLQLSFDITEDQGATFGVLVGGAIPKCTVGGTTHAGDAISDCLASGATPTTSTDPSN